MLNRLAALGALGLMAACSGPGPIVGGPCSYEESVFTAQPAGFTADGVQFTDPMDDTPFEIKAAAFETFPVIGTDVLIRREVITKGTCTPRLYFPAEG